MANIFNTPLDSLPYFDKDLDEQPHLRPQINSLLAIELRSLLPSTSTSTPTNLTHLSAPRPLPTSSPLLLSELQRIESKKPIPKGEGLDTTRYSLPTPLENSDSFKDSSAWEESYNSSLAQLEHQRLRNLNGSLLQSLGSNAWKVQNYAMENSVARLEKLSEEMKLNVEEVNRDRKSRQERGGEDLNRLETKWTTLVSGNLQVEIGCMALEAEVMQLHAKHAALQQRLQAPSNVTA